MSRALTIALAAVAGCKKKQGGDVEAPPVRVNPPEVALQVVSVSPDVVGVGRAATVVVLGAGFQQGAMVRLGDLPATGVTHRNGNQLQVSVPAMPAGVYDVAVMNPDANEGVLRAGLSVRDPSAFPDVGYADCRYVIVYFGTNDDTLAGDVRSALDAALPCWQSSEVPIRVDGHADERGTTDYNLALGERRALAVRDYLVAGGVARSRLLVTSYGEEYPAERGYGEAAWSRNRRVELKIE